MKNIIRLFTLTALASFVMASCSEDEIPYYSGPNGVNLKATTTDMSFLAFGADVTEYTFELEVELLDVKTTAARTVQLKLGEGNTAIENTDFTYPHEVTIPAGAVTAVVPIKVFRERVTEIQETLTVQIEVIESNGFVGGVTPSIDFTFTAEFPEDWFISAGPSWNIPAQLGTCTLNKYKFVYEFIGTIDLAAYSEMWPAYYLKGDLNAAIAAYNNGKPESEWLLDDDGSLLSFP